MNPIVRLVTSHNKEADTEDRSAIEDFATLLVILLAQLDADTTIQQMHRVAGLIVCHASAIQGQRRSKSEFRKRGPPVHAGGPFYEFQVGGNPRSEEFPPRVKICDSPSVVRAILVPSRTVAFIRLTMPTAVPPYLTKSPLKTKRRRFKQVTSLADRLRENVEELQRQPAELPPGPG